MARFGSREWFESYCDAVNASDDISTAAAGWHVVLDYVIEADADAGVDETIYARVAIDDGRCTEARPVSREESGEAPFVFRGPYGVWKQIVTGQLDPLKAILQGRLKLKGDLELIKQNVEATNALVGAASAVATDFADEAEE